MYKVKWMNSSVERKEEGILGDTFKENEQEHLSKHRGLLEESSENI